MTDRIAAAAVAVLLFGCGAALGFVLGVSRPPPPCPETRTCPTRDEALIGCLGVLAIREMAQLPEAQECAKPSTSPNAL